MSRSLGTGSLESRGGGGGPALRGQIHRPSVGFSTAGSSDDDDDDDEAGSGTASESPTHMQQRPPFRSGSKDRPPNQAAISSIRRASLERLDAAQLAELDAARRGSGVDDEFTYSTTIGPDRSMPVGHRASTIQGYEFNTEMLGVREARQQMAGVLPTEKLRALEEDMGNLEQTISQLRDENDRLRAAVLRSMRGSGVIGKLMQSSTSMMVIACFRAWSQIMETLKNERYIESLQHRALEGLRLLTFNMFQASGKQLMGVMVQSWRKAVAQMRDESRMMEELNAHRRGREQLIQKYQELEKELAVERRKAQEFHTRLVEGHRTLEMLKEELSTTHERIHEQENFLAEERDQGNNLRMEIVDTQAQLQDLQNDVESCTLELSATQEKLDVTELEKSSKEQQLKETEDEGEKLQLEVMGLQETKRQIMAATDAQDKRLQGLQDQLNQANALIANSRKGVQNYFNKEWQTSKEVEEYRLLKENVERLQRRMEGQPDVAPGGAGKTKLLSQAGSLRGSSYPGSPNTQTRLPPAGGARPAGTGVYAAGSAPASRAPAPAPIVGSPRQQVLLAPQGLSSPRSVTDQQQRPRSLGPAAAGGAPGVGYPTRQAPTAAPGSPMLMGGKRTAGLPMAPGQAQQQPQPPGAFPGVYGAGSGPPGGPPSSWPGGLQAPAAPKSPMMIPGNPLGGGMPMPPPPLQQPGFPRTMSGGGLPPRQ